MNYNIFFTSDTHFGHEKMVTFLDYSGNLMRPFKDSKEVDELMIENWNKIVRPKDKVYHLGDLSYRSNQGYITKILNRLNGTKVLIKGNHDLFPISFYSNFFKDVRGCHQFEGYIMTHIPIHPDSKSRFKKNIHGHTHRELVKINGELDTFYFNVCVDANNYTPVPYEEIKEKE